MFSMRGSRVRVAVVATLALSIAFVKAHDESPDRVEARLHGLVEGGAITESQHHMIERLFSKAHLSQLDTWLTAQETAARLTRETHLYLNALLGIGTAERLQQRRPTTRAMGP